MNTIELLYVKNRIKFYYKNNLTHLRLEVFNSLYQLHNKTISSTRKTYDKNIPKCHLSIGQNP